MMQVGDFKGVGHFEAKNKKIAFLSHPSGDLGLYSFETDFY